MPGGHACDRCNRYFSPERQSYFQTMDSNIWCVFGTCSKCGPTRAEYEVGLGFKVPPLPSAPASAFHSFHVSRYYPRARARE